MNKQQDILPYAKLLLNIDFANYDEVYLDGFDSAKAEKTDENNPYQEGSVEHFYWSEGWWAGFYEQEPLFTWDTVASATSVQAQSATQVKAQVADVQAIDKTKNKHSAIKLYWQVFAALLASLMVYEMVDLMI